MKIRKILFLMVMFLFLATLIVVMPNKVSATETMSDEFKQILNEEGKLVVTDTSMLENEVEFLNEYVRKYDTDDYCFYVIDYNEANSTCNIAMYGNDVDEQHEIQVIFQEKISDEFKSILKDSKIQIQSSIKDRVEEMLNTYLYSMSYNELNPNANYIFEVAAYWNESGLKNLIDENYTKATIMMRNQSYQLLEQHIVELSYLTEPSDAFKTILTNGKVQISASTKNGLENIINNYLNTISNSDPNYVFEVDSCDENYTKATILMKNKYYQLIEQHIVELSYLTEPSEEFKKELNDDGKLVINSIKPANEDEFMTLFELLLWKQGMSYSFLSEDFTSCDLTVNDETHTVGIVYNYDKQIKEKLQGFVNNFPEDINFFKVQDMELINYWVNTAKNEEKDTFTYYSGEFKSYLNNYNVTIEVDNRAGMDGPFVTERLGMFLVKYNDITYYVESCLGAKGEHIIYVPDETGDSKEELMAAAQKRIDEYIGKDKVKLSYVGTVYDFFKKEYEYISADEELEDGELEYVINVNGVKATDYCFMVTIEDRSFYIIIKKDSSKMITPSYATADITTDVSISSTASSIPLDTSIEATKITSGAEYDKIIKILNVENSETFELKLYSESLEEYITKLEDGTFEVKIPLSQELEGKKLIVYYVDQNDEVTEHEVTVKDGYAIFNTDHFSIYTLAEVKVTEENNNDNKEDSKSDNANGDLEASDNSNINTDNNNKDNSSNPTTGDNIMFFTGMLLIATMGIIITTKFRKHYKNK